MRKTGWLKTCLIPEKKLREALELYPGKTREEVRERLYRELRPRLLYGGLMAVFLLALAFVFGTPEPEEAGIIRPAPGEASASVQIQVELGEERKTVPMEIGPLEYEESRIEELHIQATEYLEHVVPGENKDFYHVTESLVFPGILPATGGEIYWTTDAPWLVTSEGEVLNASLEEPVTVQIHAEVFYGSESRFFEKEAVIYPAVYTEEELLLRKIQLELVAQEQVSRKEKRFVLPESVLGYRIEQVEMEKVSGRTFLILLAVIVPLFLYSNYFGNLDTCRKERKEQAESSYTEFVTKLSLLLAAGISVRQAFVRLAEEYEKSYGPQFVLSAELKVTKQELDNGRSESVVYEAFGRRIGVLAYRRMASLLTRNVSKGVQDMRSLLLQEAREVMAQDRAKIRQKGEQAGTKLLLPMMGLLVLVFAVLLVPAFQSF